LFPLLAGPIESWEASLPRIAEMGFDWIYVNPFHYPGFSGSLYAVKDYYRLHPLLARDDEDHDTVLRRFVQQAKEHGLDVMMDLVINHTSKDAVLVDEYPEAYLRDEHGELVSPSAIDPADARKVTVWGDLAVLDYSREAVRDGLVVRWKELISRFMGLGFSGFRCDAAYQLPGSVWSELIEYGRSRGEVVFLAETLGCRLEQMRQLATAGFDAFYNSSKWWDFREPWLLAQYESFRDVAPSISFPESHDTQRLATDLGARGIVDQWRVEAAYRLRYLFAAFFSSGVMMPMGFETGQRRKLDVVGMRPSDYDAPLFDLSAFIAAANRMKRGLSVLCQEGPQWCVTPPGASVVGLMRAAKCGTERSLALINPSHDCSCDVVVDSLVDVVGDGFRVVCDTNLGAVEGVFERGAVMRMHPLSMRVLYAGW